MKAIYKKHILNFKRASGTSRGVLNTKETWFLILENKGKTGIGECGLFKGLSYDDVPEYEEKLEWLAGNISQDKKILLDALTEFPSIQFGLEQALLSLCSSNPFQLFKTPFLENERPISINGLVWMGDIGFMKDQIQEKIEQGFSCIKIKIGALDFQKELHLLEGIRNTYSKEQIELRVDANGAFKPSEALGKLTALSRMELHSIEQPIKQHQWNQLSRLCAGTPLPIALDEELIGILDIGQKEKLLETIRPQYIILKPSLIGGFAGSKEWIRIAQKYNIGWWVTSALESNIGLNAIAQWTTTLSNTMPQGLGTGSLFTNNIESPLEVENGGLLYRQNKEWNKNIIKELCT